MKTLLKEINRRYFRDNPVRFKMRFEGQGLTDNNLYLLGGRAGPIDCISIEYLLHEMCHLAEREKDKLIEKPASSWGFCKTFLKQKKKLIVVVFFFLLKKNIIMTRMRTIAQ